MSRLIVIGDVHGCLDELDNLVQTLSVGPEDRVIMVGDLIDRGPDPVGVVRRVRERGWECVIGNHEDRALRWLRNESMRRDSGRPNGMRSPFPNRLREWEALSGEDLAWLWKLPPTIAANGWVVVHAGLESCAPLAEQEYDQLLRLRFVDRDGRHVNMDPDRMEQPEGTAFWAEAWRGENVMYGHSVFDEVRFDTNGGTRCVGLDTGCVYGGKLSAAVLDTQSLSLEIVQVQAAKEYFNYNRRKE